MPKAVLLVLANAAPGREDEFDEWYETRHIPDVLAVDGFRAVRRFSLSEHQLPGSDPLGAQYATVWDIEADDLADPLARMAALVGTDAMPISPAMVTAGVGAVRTVLLEEIDGPTRAAS
jgi:hypothetical protein